MTWTSLALAVALAIGWSVDRSALARSVVSQRAQVESARAKAKQALADLAGAQKELKLTKQALFDGDETRVMIGKRALDCEQRELAALTALEKCQKR